MDLGLLQKDLAALVGVSVCTITNWELGRTQPKACYLVQIGRFLGAKSSTISQTRSR